MHLLRLQGEAWKFNANPLPTVNKIQTTIIKAGGPGIIRGYENPHDIQWAGSLDFYTNSCPLTKLVVIVRHPILWFESVYNYRKIKGESWAIRGEPNDLIVRHHDRHWGGTHVNSHNDAFHYWLAVLGKTEFSDEELALLEGWYKAEASSG